MAIKQESFPGEINAIPNEVLISGQETRGFLASGECRVMNNLLIFHGDCFLFYHTRDGVIGLGDLHRNYFTAHVLVVLLLTVG